VWLWIHPATLASRGAPRADEPIEGTWSGLQCRVRSCIYNGAAGLGAAASASGGV
jgi:hypothetical protein